MTKRIENSLLLLYFTTPGRHVDTVLIDIPGVIRVSRVDKTENSFLSGIGPGTPSVGVITILFLLSLVPYIWG